jgi:hypothetical protein
MTIKTGTNEKIEQSAAKPTQKSNNKIIFWILGGCLALLLIGGLIVGGFAWWGYSKIKKEIKAQQSGMAQQQNKMAIREQGTAPVSVDKNENIPEDSMMQQPASIPEEPVSIADPGVPSDINPPAASEKAIGFLKKVYAKNGKNYIDIDYVQWLSGDVAEKAMREDGMCPKTGECIVYNDYYIRNQNPLIRTFEVSPDAEILAHDFSADYGAGNWNESWTFSRFSNYFNRNANNGYWDSAPFHVEIGNNKVLKITEQYIP